MSGKLLEKYVGRAGLSDEGDISDADGTENLGAFGFLRGTRERSVMIELRKKSGNILAIGYGYVDRVQFDPSEGIVLFCGSRSIVIKGKNLNSEIRPQVTLFQAITRARVPWVAESDQAALLQAAKHAVVIEAIEW